MTVQPISLSDHANWNDAEGWLASQGHAQHGPLKNPTSTDGQQMEATWASPSTQVHDSPDGNHQQYLLRQLANGDPIAVTQAFGLPHFVTSPMDNVPMNPPLTSRPDFETSELCPSSNNGFSRNYPVDWHSLATPVEAHVKRGLPPAGPWSCCSSQELYQTCPPSIYSIDPHPMNVSAVDPPNYPKPMSDHDAAQQCPGPQIFPAPSDLDFLASDLAMTRPWRRAASSQLRSGSTWGATRVDRPPFQRRRSDQKSKRQTSTEGHVPVKVPPRLVPQNEVTPGNTTSPPPSSASILRAPSPGSSAGGQYSMPKQNVQHVLLEKFRHCL
jgi:hypothetical protein